MALGGNFDTIDERSLVALQGNGVTEGPTLEFKRDQYGPGDEAKKEFLKDISALANTLGGHLVIGIDEIEGSAGPIVAISGDADAEVLRLENLARDSLQPRIIGLKVRAVPVADGFAILIRVPKSLHAPHRISFRGSNKFYGRNAGGAYELSVEELRSAFSASSTALERAKAFHLERTMLIDADSGIQPVSRRTGVLILHVIPMTAFTGSIAIDVDQRSNPSGLSPIGTNGAMAPQLNFEGFVNGDMAGFGYTQLFRNGIIEATSSYVVAPYQEQNWVLATEIETKVEDVLPRYLATLTRLEVPAPAVVAITVLDTEGARVDIGRNRMGYRMGLPAALRDPQLTLPMVTVDDFESYPQVRRLLRPMFDALYNAAGVSRAQMFDEHGDWVGGQPY